MQTPVSDARPSLPTYYPPDQEKDERSLTGNEVVLAAARRQLLRNQRHQRSAGTAVATTVMATSDTYPLLCICGRRALLPMAAARRCSLLPPCWICIRGYARSRLPFNVPSRLGPGVVFGQSDTYFLLSSLGRMVLLGLDDSVDNNPPDPHVLRPFPTEISPGNNSSFWG